MSGKTFQNELGFCPECGAILPLLGDKGGVKCYTCKQEFGPEVFGDMRTQYVIHFNSPSDLSKLKRSKRGKGKAPEAEGPTVERQCPVCKNTTMSYATLQLRSADEGQTVFYTCTKCKYKENENS
ncbi:DNA-directed RNA polymerase I subunit RPA12 [Bacillus rossius redtenbacheri]|uniref:DNA-directed RNA polymerase I subunit RPA12 n=1 Tax=Bacillus rossius redtenbacheri TaxID=93214 RepID=UPI002FDE51C1